MPIRHRTIGGLAIRQTSLDKGRGARLIAKAFDFDPHHHLPDYFPAAKIFPKVCAIPFL